MALAQVALTSGRSIELSDLRLSSTYGAMSEGYPFPRWNDRKLEGVLESARAERPSFPVHMVPPVREWPDVAPGSFGPVELLPAVTCVGFFFSQPVDAGKNSVLYHSALTVVWLQATPDIPSGEDADPGLRDLCWDEIAGDFEL
ncbi:hypothetical protein [Nocardia donostiensis]|uniref:Uncharacterized protein n=1 Tax=Nocardia donostiensis TaxID=1538463 RepID=A0A1W0B114_9NOCA|nr:hypothetical protein [Nocardia donostiensis]ONM45954.1 hypothetical protein B0T46_25630 [Nocardia donostiensis]OQS16203.1 hypothetical protein B0T36_05330 [Nocardia donostiensis]OQS16486.1 hypothetical protein B0T44_25240 [Nocardia donostiensis]